MKFKRLEIPDVVLVIPTVIKDDRGSFYESYNAHVFANGIKMNVAFVQDNHSNSGEGTLRGLHYQIPPKAQGKLVRVVSGSVFDVAVDLRRSSPTFGQWVSEILSEDNHHQLWIPPGFAHGFLAISDSAELLYKTTDYYDPERERILAWDDPKIDILWPLSSQPNLSPKDQNGDSLSKSDCYP